MVFFALCILPLLMILGTVVDLGMARAAGNRLQIAADAAALAGAGSMELECNTPPFAYCVRQVAKDFASRNISDSQNGSIPALADEDIVLGRWDPETRTFTPNPTEPNAVEVTTRRPNMTALFGGLFDFDAFNLTRHAIAISEPGAGCESGGLFSEDVAIIQSDGVHISGFCLYGARGITTSQNNYFAPGTIVAVNPGQNIDDGGQNPGLEDASRYADFPLRMPEQASRIIAAMETGTGIFPEGVDGLPFGIDPTRLITTSEDVVFGEAPGMVKIGDDTVSIQSNAIYVLSGDKKAEFKSGTEYSNIGVVASNITIGSDVNIKNVVLGARDFLDVNSNVTIGYDGFCSTGQYASYLFSNGYLKVGSNARLYGVQMTSKEEGMDLASGGDNSRYKGINGETLGKLEYQSGNEMSACNRLIRSAFGSSTNPFGISALALVD